MNKEDLVKRLEGVQLPHADLAEHRRQLRAALLARSTQPMPSRYGVPRRVESVVRRWTIAVTQYWRMPPWSHKLAMLGAGVLVMIVCLIMVVPILDSQSPSARAAEIACSSTEVKEALGGFGAEVVRVIEEGPTSVVILRCAGVTHGRSDLVLASVDMTSKAVISATVVSSPTHDSAYVDRHALVVKLSDDGEDTVLLAAEGGLWAISQGSLKWQVFSVSAISAVALLRDVTGDGVDDVVAACESWARCYDGATGAMVWQSECGQRRVFQNGLGWGSVGSYVESIQVLRSGVSQIVCAASADCVYGIDALDGVRLWQFEAPDTVTMVATVTNGDGADRLLVGTRNGSLSLVSGVAGKTVWRRDIGGKWVECDEVQHGAIESIDVYDEQGHQAVISVGDGRVCLIDLNGGDIKWENQIAYRELSTNVRAWVVPDVNEDGQPEVFVNKGYIGESTIASARMELGGSGTVSTVLRSVALLSGADGRVVWTAEMNNVGVAVASMGGETVLLEPHPQLGIRVFGLRDGQTVDFSSLPAFEGDVSEIEALPDGGCLLLTDDGVLVAVSPAGQVQWSYSRLSRIRVDKGYFNSDAVPDLMVVGEAPRAEGIRRVSVLDGVNGEEIWCHDALSSDAATANGLQSVQVSDDLTGDGIQDVLAYVGSTVLRFSGADGSLACFDVGLNVASLQPLTLGTAAPGMAAGTDEGLIIMDNGGARICELDYADWTGSDSGNVRVLDDMTLDGVGDLVLSSAKSIVVATSTGTNPLSFQAQCCISAGDHKTIEPPELTDDIDGDGVKEIAYVEHDQGESARSGTLLVVSPASGESWHRWHMPVTVDVACADFNGDGVRDSLVYHQDPEEPKTSAGQDSGQTLLEVCSGADDTILWSFTFETDWWSADDGEIPAVPVGDMTGDGVEELAVSRVATIDGTSMSLFDTGAASSPHETYVQIYDVVSSCQVKQLVLPPVQKDGDIGRGESLLHDSRPVSGAGDAMRLAGDLTGDGHQELAILAGYLPTGVAGGDHCLALVDLEVGEVLVYIPTLTTLDFFVASKEGTVGFAANGSICLVKVSNELQVTCPTEGASVGRYARIAWNGGTDSSSSSASVFVDGYENARTSGNEVTLPLALGEHEVVVRSLNEYGMVTYATVHFRAEGAPWTSTLACLSAIGLLFLYFAVRWARVACHWCGQRTDL